MQIENGLLLLKKVNVFEASKQTSERKWKMAFLRKVFYYYSAHFSRRRRCKNQISNNEKLSFLQFLVCSSSSLSLSLSYFLSLSLTFSLSLSLVTFFTSALSQILSFSLSTSLSNQFPLAKTNSICFDSLSLTLSDTNTQSHEQAVWPEKIAKSL